MKNIFEEFKKELNEDSDARKQSDYKNEKGIKDEYNGRQFLELLQNIDDTKSKQALIQLDTQKKIVLIANSGEPFSEGGLKSLMMPHLSPKDKTFIGNKGLGFRSLLNWAGKIYVKSENLSIEFSDENRKRQQNSTIKRSICSTPEWIDKNNLRKWINNIEFNKKYITYIAIQYRENVEEKIIEQLGKISEELMFFINHLEEIEIINNNEIKKFQKRDWEVLKKENTLPKEHRDEEDEKEHYQLKVILPPDNYHKNSYLYSYFPTNIKIDFPALIHATFELDSSRNTIVDDEKGKNRFIVQELATFIIEVAESLKKDNANWKAYEFVNITHKNETLEKFGFYKIIEEWKETAEIYPCVDNIYKTKDNWAFYTNQFSDFMENHSEVLGNTLKRNNHVSEYSRYHTELISEFNSISKKIFSIDERAEFINHILDIQCHISTSIPNSDHLILLINQDKKLKKELFFYDEMFLDLEIPSFIEIDYIYPDLQNKLDIEKLKKITIVKKFDIQTDLIEKIIESSESIQEKLQALYPLRKFDKPSKSLKGITGKYIRDKRILKILEEKEIIEDYDNLGISNLEELDKFLIWLGAKDFNAQQILSIIVEKNNQKKDIPSTLKALFILKDKFSDNLDHNRIRTEKDIFVLDANSQVENITKLFPYNETCKKENIIANKAELKLDNYSDNEIEKFLKWLGIKEFNPQNVAIEKIKHLRKKELDKDEAKEIFQFLYNVKNNNQLPDITPETDKIHIFNILSKDLFFRTKLTEKYFDKNKLLFPYYELGFENNEKSKNFFRWLGVVEADKNLIVKQIFKSDIDVKEKLQELFVLFNEDNSIERPKIEFKLKSLSGQEKEVKELYINNDITRFCKKEKVVNIPVHEYSEAFFKWLELKEPSKEEIVERLLELLTNKDISIQKIQDVVNLLVDKYEESNEIDKHKVRYLFNNKKEVLKISELYQYDKLAYKHIPDSIVCKELKLDEKFLWWIGIKKAEPFMVIRTLLKKKHKNLKDIFELWKQDVEIKPLLKNIPVKLLNRNNKEVLTNTLFLKNSLTPFYDDSELIADYEQLGLEKSDDTEKFLLWLGVNEYIKYEKDGDLEKVYKLTEIAKLEFTQLFSLIEAENILKNLGAKRYLQNKFLEHKYWILRDYGIGLINPPIAYENQSRRINLLKQFGIESDFNEKNTLFLLQQLINIDKEGRYAPKIYQEVLNKGFNFLGENFNLFSKEKTYLVNIDLMYLNTSKHPQHILKKYDFIDLPLRLDTERIYQTFNVQEIIDIDYSVDNFIPIGSAVFDDYFESIKPYLLAFGVAETKDIKDKELIANKLKALKIKFGTFNAFANNKKIELEEFEMIASEDTFYIKCEHSMNDGFSKDTNLTNSIQNILLTIDFNSHHKFRDIFRYGDFEELENILSKEYGSTTLQDAKDLLHKEKQIYSSISNQIILPEDEEICKKEEAQNISNFKQYQKEEISLNSKPIKKNTVSLEEKESISSNNYTNTNIKEVTVVDAEINTFSPKARKQNFSTTYKHSIQHEKAKVNKGYRAENIVYNHLIKEYGKRNVIWESFTNDGAGYDISYRNEKDEVKHIEVKVYSNNEFYITANELAFAKNNPKSYLIYLVDIEAVEIYPIIPSQTNFENIIPTQYKVLYSLTSTDKESTIKKPN
jgi:hypothetical protein